MIEYITNIIEAEQLKLLEKIVSSYGTKGEFTLEDLVNKFIKDRNTRLVNDKFQTPGTRGRPKKNKD